MMMSMDPRLLLGDRFGLIYYCWLVHLWLTGQRDKFVQCYSKFLALFPDEKKEHSPEIFGNLIEQIRQNGYDDYYPIVANPKNFFMKNGAHRCAVAIMLGVEQVSYSLTFSTDETPRNVFTDNLPQDDLTEVITFFQQLLASFPPALAHTIRMRYHIRSHDNAFRDAPWASKTLFPAARTYQGIGDLSGKRITETRWEDYGLAPFLSGTEEALEIGCNVGFFSSVLAKHVRHVDGFDIDPLYIETAKAYNGKNNTNFYVGVFENIKIEKKYDVLICCAVHGWVKMGFGDFLVKILGMVKDGGILLMESHEIMAEGDWRKKAALVEACGEVLNRGYIDDVDHTLYASEIREYIVLRPQIDGPVLEAMIRKHGFTVAGR